MVSITNGVRAFLRAVDGLFPVNHFVVLVQVTSVYFRKNIKSLVFIDICMRVCEYFACIYL